MPDFSPFDSEFDPTVDPITADKQGLAILDKLEEGESLRGEGGQEIQDRINAGQVKLKANLARYQKYKVARNEKLFSYEPEVIARGKALGDEKLARSAIKLLRAVGESFAAVLDENGDTREFNTSQAFMQDKSTLQKKYSTMMLLEQSGYSGREIQSGAAEPHMRTRLEAGEHESTRDAYLRWGLSKVNEVDRRRKITTSAVREATTQFLGMKGDSSSFEEALAQANPDISNEERTHIRRIYNLHSQTMEKKFSQIKPLVRKTFNTIAEQEGVASQFLEEGDAPFGSMSEAVKALSKIPKSDYGDTIAMLAETAEAHGQDVDGFFNKLGKSFGRGFSLVDRAATGLSTITAQSQLEDARRGDLVYELFDTRTPEEGLYHVTSHRVDIGATGANKGIKLERFSGTGIVTEENLPFVKWRVPSKEQAIKTLEQKRMGYVFASELMDWKEAVAKVGSDNRFVNDWIYGTARSLPEMGAAAMGLPGIALVAAAQTERNMAQIRRENPDADWEQHQVPAAFAGLGYSLLNRAQFKTLSRRMPASRKFVAEFGKRLVIETVQESMQDLTLTASLELFGAIDEDIKDHKLGKEVWDTIKRAPRTMFAVVPLVLAGTAGSSTIDYMGRKPIERVLQDTELMEAYGITEAHRDKIRALPLNEALDYVQKHNEEFLQSVVEMTIPSMEGSPIQFTANSELGTFSVTNGSATIEVRSSEEAAEAAQQLTEGEIKVEGGFTPKVDRKIDPLFVNPNTSVLHSFILPSFGNNPAAFKAGEEASRRRDGLPPLPDANTGQVTAMAKFRYGLQTFLHQRDVPSKTLQETLDVGNRKAAGVEAQFNDIAKSLDNRVRKHVKKQPTALQDTVFQQTQSDAYHALRGDTKAMARLPKQIQKVVQEGRDSLDIYSQAMIDSGQLDKDLAAKVGGNIGSYVTRQFKAHDASTGWNYKTVKEQHPQVYQAALKEIMDGGKTQKEADAIIKGMLSTTRGEKFYAGSSSIGKVNISNFIKKNNDLSDAMLDLLGEVVNPAANIRDSGAKISKIVITHQVQAHMAEQLHAAGLASDVENVDLGHTHQIGLETYTFEGVDENGDPKTFGGVRVKKSMSGFKDRYMDPELAVELERHFDPKNGRKSSIEIFADMAATVTGVGKFAQVILNPAAYPTNFLGGVATEIFNGRVSFDAKGARAYKKFGSFREFGKLPNDPYGVTDQQTFYSLTGKVFLAGGGVNGIGRNQLNTEMQQQGIRDNSVFAEDINQGLENGLWGPKVGKATRALSKAYQAADNAAKRSAFVHELDKWARAEPTKTMDELVQLAASDVRATTQNYDMVPKVIKAFSQRSLGFATYISFGYELMRNTIGTMRLARQEIASGNPVLRNAGIRRVAGMAAVGAALYGLNSLVSAWMTGMRDDEREELQSQLPPWLKELEVVYLGADGDKLRYFDASYIIPHQPFYNAVARAFKADTVGEKFTQSAKSLLQPLAGGNIMQNTYAEILMNKKRSGGEIYNEAVVEGLDRVPHIVNYAYESMFQPGVLRTWDKIKKAKKSEIGYAGSKATMNDVYLGLVGIRPYQFDTSSEAFVVDNLKGFAFTSRDASSHVSKGKQAKRGKGEKVDPETGFTPSQTKALEDVGHAEKRHVAEFELKIRMLKRLNISDERIEAAIMKAKVPRYLRAEYEGIINSID